MVHLPVSFVGFLWLLVSTVAVTAAVVSNATPATNNFFFICKQFNDWPSSDGKINYSAIRKLST
jgi:hypothetical protein